MPRLDEVRVVRAPDHAPTWRVVWTHGKTHATVTGDYANLGNAERAAWAYAIGLCARHNKRVLVVGPTGAFEIRPGRYPQKG